MIRQELKKVAQQNSAFKLRGLDNTRIEALSDGVFALSIALLLISTDIPKTYDQLLIFINDFVPFAVTITLLILVWYEHYLFFVRYGFRGPGIVALNTVLLVLVLFYVYPLKFLFSVLYKLFTGLLTRDQAVLDELFTVAILVENAPSLMVLYGLGACAVFLTLVMMYLIALKKKDSLELSTMEVFDTKSRIYDNLLMASVPFCSAMFALFDLGGKPATTFTLSGLIYMAYAILMPGFGMLRGKKRKKLISSLT
ncbi:MAG: TMEM175 family protein [Bacteroidota bacterium]